MGVMTGKGMQRKREVNDTAKEAIWDKRGEQGWGKQDRKREGTDWDCGSGIKLPICILLGMTERKRGNMANLQAAAAGVKRWIEEKVIQTGRKFSSCWFIDKQRQLCSRSAAFCESQ